MTLTGLHILLTYQCNFECDHCFVWGSPRQTGTFTLAHLKNVLQQAVDAETITEIYFEGGEPFLYYPILLKGVARAHRLGFWTGIVSNNYWAAGVDEAVAWLEPLAEAGLNRIDLSSDLWHGDKPDVPPAQHALAAAEQLGLEAGTICITPPTGYRDPAESEPGAPVTGGGVMYRGRAASVLAADLPTHPWDSFTACPYEALADPGRVHLDPAGNLHLCQGLVMGNLFQQPLKQIIQTYTPTAHPIVGPLLAGGPAQLVEQHRLPHRASYVDACHLCYTARASLRPQFSRLLTPDQMYGEFES
ncbi:MAG: radical SAM protein [Anaerolineae bacterium]